MPYKASSDLRHPSLIPDLEGRKNYTLVDSLYYIHLQNQNNSVSRDEDLLWSYKMFLYRKELPGLMILRDLTLKNPFRENDLLFWNDCDLFRIFENTKTAEQTHPQNIEITCSICAIISAVP